LSRRGKFQKKGGLKFARRSRRVKRGELKVRYIRVSGLVGKEVKHLFYRGTKREEKGMKPTDIGGPLRTVPFGALSVRPKTEGRMVRGVRGGKSKTARGEGVSSSKNEVRKKLTTLSDNAKIIQASKFSRGRQNKTFARVQLLKNILGSTRGGVTTREKALRKRSTPGGGGGGGGDKESQHGGKRKLYGGNRRSESLGGKRSSRVSFRLIAQKNFGGESYSAAVVREEPLAAGSSRKK